MRIEFKKSLVILIFLILSVALMAAEFEILYKCLNTTESAQQIQFQINLLNNSNKALFMKNLTIRYYYTNEGAQEQFLNIDYALFGSSNVIYKLEDSFLELGFTEGAGTIPANAESGEIQLRLYKSDWSPIDQTNDYSFNPASELLTPHTKMALYLDGRLVWGNPPGGQQQPSPAARANNMPSATAWSG